MIIEKNKVLIQIGTNNGNDEFNKIVRNSSPSKVILIEPNKSLNNIIVYNYNNIDNIIIENIAITNINTDKVKLVIPKNNVNGKAINGITYNSKHYSLIPMDDWGNDFDYIEVIGMTFNNLCDKYNITDIHYLQIDTEGYDSEIIKSIDFNKINIDIIKYEKWEFDENCYKRYGKDSELYGINGMYYISNLLKLYNYDLIDDNTDIIAIKNK